MSSRRDRLEFLRGQLEEWLKVGPPDRGVLVRQYREVLAELEALDRQVPKEETALDEVNARRAAKAARTARSKGRRL